MRRSPDFIAPSLRRAHANDADFFVWIDRQGESSSFSFTDDWTDDRWANRRVEMLGFLVEADRFAFVLEEESSRRQLGGICARLVNIRGPFPSWSVFSKLPAEIFPRSGWFCEIFQLWVDPACRRHGLGTWLKMEAERETMRRGIGAIYTHTEAANEHVIALNLKLGYREIRRGPSWDEVVRVSLLKTIEP